MELEEVKLWVQIVSTFITAIGIIISLYFSLTKTKTRYGFFCKIISERIINSSDRKFNRIAFGFTSGNEFDIGIQQVGIEFKDHVFGKKFYTDSKAFSDTDNEKSKAREIYYKKSPLICGKKEFKDRSGKKVYLRPYVIDMSGRVVKMSIFKMLKHKYNVDDFTYKGIPKEVFGLM